MNNNTLVIATIAHYAVEIRSSLEYALPNREFPIANYNHRKAAVLAEVDQDTWLKKVFIPNNGENGANLEKMIRDFAESVYGEKSTILRVNGDKVEVDPAQLLSLIKPVIQIHENLTAMMRGALQDGLNRLRAAKTDEERAQLDMTDGQKLFEMEDHAYRGLAYMVLTMLLEKLFADYNVARNEAHGAESPASNFIGQDIQTVIQQIGTIRANAIEHDLVYKEMEDKIHAVVENCTGRRDLPAGKRFPDVFRETRELIGVYLRDAEIVLFGDPSAAKPGEAPRGFYQDQMDALVAQVKANNEAAAAREEAAKKA